MSLNQFEIMMRFLILLIFVHFAEVSFHPRLFLVQVYPNQFILELKDLTLKASDLLPHP